MRCCTHVLCRTDSADESQTNLLIPMSCMPATCMCFYAGLAAVFAASAAARLASPHFYARLAHDACPNGLAEGLIRLSGATLIPIAAALWALKVLLPSPHRCQYKPGTSAVSPSGVTGCGL